MESLRHTVVHGAMKADGIFAIVILPTASSNSVLMKYDSEDQQLNVWIQAKQVDDLDGSLARYDDPTTGKNNDFLGHMRGRRATKVIEYSSTSSYVGQNAFGVKKLVKHVSGGILELCYRVDLEGMPTISSTTSTDGA